MTTAAWVWRRGVYDEGDTDHYRLTLDGKSVAHLAVTLPEIAVSAANNVLPPKWSLEKVKGYHALVLSGAIDHDVPPIAVLTPHEKDESWLLLSGTTLPPLNDGPLHITFPRIGRMSLEDDDAPRAPE